MPIPTEELKGHGEDRWTNRKESLISVSVRAKCDICDFSETASEYALSVLYFDSEGSAHPGNTQAEAEAERTSADLATKKLMKEHWASKKCLGILVISYPHL